MSRVVNSNSQQRSTKIRCKYVVIFVDDVRIIETQQRLPGSLIAVIWKVFLCAADMFIAQSRSQTVPQNTELRYPIDNLYSWQWQVLT